MGRILVLDDRVTERELLSTVLGYGGHSVVEAQTGREALEIIHKDHFDLVISDVMMPEMNGYELVRSLREDAAVSDTRVIFWTASFARDEVQRVANTCGVSEILVKPCDPQDILEKVAEVLESDAPAENIIHSDQFDREQLRVLNNKLMAQIAELEQLNASQQRLHDELEHSRRESAEALSLLETLQSTAPLGLGFVDREFRIQRINATLAATNGLPIEKQLGQRVADIVPDLWPQLEPLYKCVLNGEAVLNQETVGEVPSAPGETGYWLTSFYPVYVEAEVIGIGVIVVDVTKSKHAEHFLSVIMDNIAEGLFATDRDGCLSLMNPAAEKMLGWVGGDLKGRSIHDAFHFQHADGTKYPYEQSSITKAQKDGVTVRVVDDVFTRSDGTLLPVSYSAAPLLDEFGASGVVVVFRDTTEEKDERARIQRELEALSWVGRIRDAFTENRFVLYSQPIVALSEGKPGEELLIRMIGRDGEVILPGIFLPVAEKYGLIREIDQWVITHALLIAATGRYVHVNISADSVSNLELLATIRELIESKNIDASNVTFELTETALIDNFDAGEALARGITELGCGLALDDFGTGFGSFTYLQRLPVTYLKIDTQFVRDLPQNSVNQHLVRAIVTLAQGFGLKTVAEGVENAETVELLKQLGVDYGQGFYLGRPQHHPLVI